MNKREKSELISQIARWEWMSGGSTSQAAAVNSCIEELCGIFKLSEDDLLFDRVWEMGKVVCERNGSEMTDDWSDALSDFVDEIGYREAVDVLESDDWAEFYSRISARIAP